MYLKQSDFTNAVRTSVHALRDCDPKQMTDTVMSDFNRFLNSHQTMELNSTFTVYFQVLSPQHTACVQNRRKAIPVRHKTGTHSGNTCRAKGSLLSLPVGFPDSPFAFLNLCTVVNLLFGWLKYNNLVDYKIVKTLCNVKQNNLEKNGAGEIMVTLMDMFYEITLVERGKLDLNVIVPIFSRLMNVQVHVICSFSGCVPTLISYPPKNDYSLQRLYFVEYQEHLYFIEKLDTCFRYNRKCICFDCKRFYSSGFDSYHVCKERRNCYYCKGILMAPNTLEMPTAGELVLFCDSEIKPTFNQYCEVCNRTFWSQKCFNNHLQFCKKNNYGWFCDACDTFVNLKLPAKVLKERHTCGNKLYRCKYCFEIKENEHVCKVETQTFHKEWCNLGFINIKSVFPSSGNCNECFQKREKFMTEHNLNFKQLFQHNEYPNLSCANHTEKSDCTHCNVISVIVEKNRFEFSEEIFCDDILNINVNSTFNFKYSQTKTPVTKTCYKAKKRVQSTNNLHDELFKKNKGWAAASKFMYFLRNEDIANTTFLVPSDEMMQAIYQIVLAHFVKPDVIQKGRKVFLLELPGIKVRFINFSSYVSGTLGDLKKQFCISQSLHFFPQSWNQNKNYFYEGSLPPLNDFFEFNDSEDDRKAKTFFYNSLRYPWNFKNEIIENCRTNCQVFSTACLKFLKLCFQLQTKIAHLTKNATFEAIHPFGGRLSSLSGFSMAVFKFYFLNKTPMFTVLLPYSGSPTGSSKGEYECLSLLAYEHPELELKTAFNNPGKLNYIVVYYKNYIVVYCKVLVKCFFYFI
jgi:hypothetical protein